MFARNISFRLKPDSIAAFTKLIEDEVLPLLRKQKGSEPLPIRADAGRAGFLVSARPRSDARKPETARRWIAAASV